jgi:Bacterial low temperature requirement A protein (LtrA)
VTWSDLVRPPRLQDSETDAGQQRTATWLELFFDLAFVVVVGELTVGLRNDLTLHGVLVFAGLFTSAWWAWAGFTFYANRVDTDDVVYRLAKLAAMLAVAGLVASATDATGSLATQFALCQAALRLVLVGLLLRAFRHVVQARSLLAVYVVAEGYAAVLWLAGAVVPTAARYGCWAVAVAAEVGVPIMATMRSAGLPLHVEHLPERFGLFVWGLCGGVALYLFALTAIQGGITGSLCGSLPCPGSGAADPCCGLRQRLSPGCRARRCDGRPRGRGRWWPRQATPRHTHHARPGERAVGPGDRGSSSRCRSKRVRSHSAGATSFVAGRAGLPGRRRRAAGSASRTGGSPVRSSMG